MAEEYAGIDYGLGKSNIDPSTGIRFGVIAVNSIDLDKWNDAEGDYGEPTCPKCGSEVKASDADDLDFDDENLDDDATPTWFDGQDFVCVPCQECYWSEQVYGEEAISYHLVNGEYALHSGFDNTEVFVEKSPYYTFAQFCSPCVPGAGNLDHPCESGPKTYALGHEWFDCEFDEVAKAPYRVFRVADDTEVLPVMKARVILAPKPKGRRKSR